MANTLKLGAGKWATGTDTVLAFNDENNNFKPLPFSFSRASSATVVNQSGLIETVSSGTPRIDFLGNTKGALLLEPQRTNLIPYSEDFSNVGWTKSNVTLTSGFASPSADSPLGAYLLVPNTSNNFHYIQSNNGGNLSGSGYNMSFFVKPNGYNFVRVFNQIAGIGVDIDIVNEVVSNKNIEIGDVTIKQYGDWKRIQVEYIGSRTFSYLAIQPMPSALSGATFVGDGTSGVYIFGAQLEVGSYATSYIPTSGQSGGVTRVLDSCSQTVPDGVIGQTEGTVYCEVDVKSGYDTNNLMVTLSNGTNLKQIYINRSNGKLEFFVGTNVNEMLYVSPSVLTNGVHKLALAYKQDDFAVAIDGVIAHTDNSGNVPTCNKINVGSHYNGNLPFNDRINDVKLYNTRLSNAELQALTTI